MEKIIEQLKLWVIKNYNPTQCGWTTERSRGNCDDCFEDGQDCASSWCAYDVGQILGMELEEPDVTEDDE